MIIHTKINNIELNFRTNENLFSPYGIDKGTLAMLSIVDLKEDDKVLDLGCGSGPVGIYAAKVIGAENVVMTDIDKNAVEQSRENADLNDVAGIKIVQGDAYESIEDSDFSIILVNPPYHADFSVPKKFIEKGFNRLNIGGRMYMVTKRKEWYKNKLISIFGGVKIEVIDNYYVFIAEKRQSFYSKKGVKK